MRKILLVSDGFFHPPLLARRILNDLFRSAPECSVQSIRTLGKLPADLDAYSALVLYFHHREISDPALARLQAYVSNGGGLLAVHAATASFKEQPAYAELVGGSFAGHGPISEFEYQPAAESAVFAGLPGFTVRDELYLHEFEPGIQVHYTTLYEGEQVPVVWTRMVGDGRVCAAVPGHTAGSLRNPAYRQVLLRALEWVSGS